RGQPVEPRGRRRRQRERHPSPLALTRPHLDHRRLPSTREARHDVELHLSSFGDPAAAVCDRRGVERENVAVFTRDLAQAAALVKCADRTVATVCQWTILAMGSSMMPEAPWSLSVGMSVLISDFATTASTAYPPSPASFDTVGDRSAGSNAITPSRRASSTLSFTSTRPRASSAPLRSV